ncbi:MAG: exodeoxyribonuclease VII large subunit [Xanthomonadales bacterium]|nr:exodeoxyribonuclease VII large subunit [Gammaproteobacteria bacterium]NNK37754.1 exodeoxyribonuclease VII large subunit [Xanthomonadales bacterium]
MSHDAEHVYTPSELNRELKLHLEAGFPRLVLEGEISNLGRPASGHLYFSLKDERAQIRCAMFRSAAMRALIKPENGMKVTARGRISLYEPRGEYQLIVESLQEAGEGLLQQQFEALKKKLDSEGLFDPARKRALPRYPARIALITSPSGAAVRDLLHVLERRWPVARVRLYPVRVQGSEAPLEIRAAIEAANRHAWADLLIAGRGGGSLEDLWAFNDEAVARSMAASAIPVISAVGHETDFSICDFVADLRAPTPSAAAELATPDRFAMIEAFRRLERQLQRREEGRLQHQAQRLDHLAHRLQQRHPATRVQDQSRDLSRLGDRLGRAARLSLRGQEQRLDQAERRLTAQRPDRRLEALALRLANAEKSLERQVEIRVRNARERLGHLSRTLHVVSPLQTLGRGYAVLTSEDGTVVSSTTQVKAGDDVSAQVSDGSIGLTVKDRRKT